MILRKPWLPTVLESSCIRSRKEASTHPPSPLPGSIRRRNRWLMATNVLQTLCDKTAYRARFLSVLIVGRFPRTVTPKKTVFRGENRLKPRIDVYEAAATFPKAIFRRWHLLTASNVISRRAAAVQRKSVSE